MKHFDLALTLFFILVIILPVACFASTSHCWRQDVSRQIAPAVTPSGFFSNESTEYDYLIVIGSKLSITGFGDFVTLCDDGASRRIKNYVDLYDAITGRIIATNVVGDKGPQPGGGDMCVSGGNICYIDSGVYYPPKGRCDSGQPVGAGNKDIIEIVMDRNMIGAHEFEVRLGAISPANEDKYSEKILHKTAKKIKVLVGLPSLMVFAQQELRRINYFEEEGQGSEEILFTLTNKSPFPIILENYSMNCSEGVKCELERRDDGKLFYKGYKIMPNNSMIINGKVIIDKSKIPMTFFLNSFDVNYSVDGLQRCDFINNLPYCSTKTTPMEFESGLLDKQDFQINVLGKRQARECINADGDIGKTGENYAPRVNLYFGGNSPPEKSSEAQLISIDECSSVNNVTGEQNPNWVYCSQREFIIQLANRIGKAAEKIDLINSFEEDQNYSEADKLRMEMTKLLNFTAYLRKQSINKEAILNSQERLETFLFKKIGLDSSTFGSSGEDSKKLARLRNLLNGMDFFKTINGLIIDEKNIDPGLYNVVVDLNSKSSLLFDTQNKLIDGVKIKVKLEKISEPPFEWFFYNDEATDSFAEVFESPKLITKYRANVLDRGSIMSFIKDPSGRTDGNFYSNYAVPIIIKLSDTEKTGEIDAFYEVRGFTEKSEMFTFWTGFASTQEEGCGTISNVSSSGGRELPYRIPDVNIRSSTGNQMFGIREFSSVIKDSNIYLETVIYVPTTGSEAPEYEIITPFDIYSLFDSCTRKPKQKCELKFGALSDYAKKFRATTIKEVFDGIRDGNICVFKDTSQQVTRWQVFWNQEKIVESMNEMKASIKDAKLCKLGEG